MCEKPQGIYILDWLAHRYHIALEHDAQLKDIEAARRQMKKDYLRLRLKHQAPPVAKVRVIHGTIEYEAAIDVANQRRVVPAVMGRIYPRSMMTITFKRALDWYEYHQALALRYKAFKIQSGIVRNEHLARIKMGEAL